MVKHIIYPALIFISIVSCTKPDSTAIPANPTTQEPQLTGGKGGNFSIVAFTKQGSNNVEARVFLKYAADKAQADTNSYDEKATAVKEPGYGNHVHFNSLKAGTYFLHATYMSAVADTVIKLDDNSDVELDISLELK